MSRLHRLQGPSALAAVVAAPPQCSRWCFSQVFPHYSLPCCVFNLSQNCCPRVQAATGSALPCLGFSQRHHNHLGPAVWGNPGLPSWKPPAAHGRFGGDMRDLGGPKWADPGHQPNTQPCFLLSPSSSLISQWDGPLDLRVQWCFGGCEDGCGWVPAPDMVASGAVWALVPTMLLWGWREAW